MQRIFFLALLLFSANIVWAQDSIFNPSYNISQPQITDRQVNYQHSNVLYEQETFHSIYHERNRTINLHLATSGSSDFEGRSILIGTSAGLAIGIPLGIARQIKKGSANCNGKGPGDPSHWTDCVLGPHPIVKNILIWGGLGFTFGYQLSF